MIGVYGFEDPECNDTRRYPECAECGEMIRESYYILGRRHGDRKTIFCQRCIQVRTLRDFWEEDDDG